MTTFLRATITIAIAFLTASPLITNAQPTPPVRIMPLGDSITNGIANTGGYRKPLYDLLTAAGYNVDYVGTQTSNGSSTFDSDHQGHSGWRIAQLDANVEGWFASIAGPDVILLHIGTNDFGANDNITTAIDRLDALILKMATLRPGANIIVTNLMERNETANTNIQTHFNPFVQTRVAAHAAAGRKVTFLDMRAAVPLSDMPDNLHPNQTGYDKMAAAWLPAIQAVITPQGDISPPTIARARGNSDGRSVNITFSKPVDDTTATNLANYTIDNGIILSPGGLNASTLSLSADKYTVTLTPSSIPVFNYGTTYTVSVSNITDRLDPANTILPNSTATFTRATARGYLANVPESTSYTLVHSLDVPTNPNYVTNPHPAYSVDNRIHISQFDRVAYYLELQRPGGDIEYAWVSMDAFTTDINKIGVPTFASGAIFEQNVTNLSVTSNVSGVLNTVSSAGNIEFWPNNYSNPANSSIGGNTTTYDIDDTRSTTGAYGSMQVHNTTDKKTVFAINNFGAGGAVDIGIGNNPTPASNGVDWTFAVNGGNYLIKTLHVLVQTRNDNTGPAILSATATAGRNRIYLKFSEPVARLSLDPAQFSLSHGVTVFDIVLADNQVDAYLTTTTQPADTPLTLTANNVRDTSPNANRTPTITIPVSSPALPPEILTNVGAAAQNYELVYSIDLPNVGNLRARGNSIYHWDDSANPTPFSRVAYYLELQKPNQPAQYLWVSMDSFTGDRRKLGVPLPATNAVHQRLLTNMDVASNVAGVTNGTGISTGNIEFWPTDYSIVNAQAIPGASDTILDFGDTRSTSGGFGSMQIHNHGASQTLFAINRWGTDGNPLDIGIGSSPPAGSNTSTDWTNTANAAGYSKKTLHVLVLPSPPPVVPEPVATNIPEAQGYQLVYSLDIPAQGNLSAPAYSVNNSQFVGPFKRIAYYMQLQTGAAAPEYVWVSVDPFTNDATRIGVPNGVVFQQNLTNMNVVSNKAGVVNGTNIATGNIEFWPSNYTNTRAAVSPPNARNDVHDFGDSGAVTTAGHGSMQIHNHGGSTPHTLFSITNWGSTSATANLFGMGIGNSTGTHPDWTFAANSASFSSRLLQVYVLPGEPDTTGPTPARAVGSSTLNRLILTLNEPIANASALAANFTIPGLTIHSATLLPDKKDVILTTSPQTPGTSYTVTVSNLSDRSPNANLSPIGASTTFTAHVPPPILATIPEASGYDLIHQLAIPTAQPQWNLKDITYSVDESKYGERPFSRVAYLMELDSHWVFVSFDPHTNQITKTGIPTPRNTATPFQQKVTNLTVASNKPGIVTGTNLPGGNIEFWHGNYAIANALNIPNASATTFDWGDTMSAGAHATFQVHNHLASQVLFAYNNWGSNTGGNSELGIGNQPTNHPDWTSSNSAGNYAIKNLYVLAQPGPSIPAVGTGPSILEHPLSKLVHTGDNYTLSVNASGVQPLSYQWRRNGIPIPGATSSWLDLTNITSTDAGSYDVIVSTPNYVTTTSQSALLIVGNTVPQFSGYRFTTTRDTSVDITAASILANASDVDLDELSLINVAPATTAGGTATLSAGLITYTPPTGYLGADTFNVTIADEASAQVQGPIHITIVPSLPQAGTNSIITSRADGKIDAIFVGEPGETYEIQRSTTLMPDDWEPIGTVMAGDDTFIPIHDATPPPTRGFYRAVLIE